MTRGIREQLRQFAGELLERRGGLVDWPAEAREGTAVVPPEVAALLPGHEEVVRLSEEPGGPGWSVNLATDFLEVAGRLLDCEPCVGAFRLPERYLKRAQLDEALARTFDWLNARVRRSDTRAVPVEYHTWWFHASLVSEDRWETCLAATVNAASGATIDLPDPLGLWELQPGQSGGPPPAATYHRAAAAVGSRVPDLAAEFVARMEGRLLRDRKRLRDYYHALLREADAKQARAHVKASPEEIETKKRAVDLELRRKLTELEDRYAMELALRPIALARTQIPVLAVDLAVQRKQAHRLHTAHWNPLLKHFEPMLCSRCASQGFSVAFTNEHVLPLCRSCWEAAPASRPAGTAPDRRLSR